MKGMSGTTRRWLSALAAAVAASLAEAGPVSAGEIVRSGAWTSQDTGAFIIEASIDEVYGACVRILKKDTGETRLVCDYAADVLVDDLLLSASGRMRADWSYTTTTSTTKGKKITTTETTVSGTTTADLTWIQNGDVTITTDASPTYSIVVPWCYQLFTHAPYCEYPTVDTNASLMRQRPAVVTGTVTDSEWGTFTFSNEAGGMADYHQSPI